MTDKPENQPEVFEFGGAVEVQGRRFEVWFNMQALAEPWGDLPLLEDLRARLKAPVHHE